MKIQLKKFPNGAHFLFEGQEFTRVSRDRFKIEVASVGDTPCRLYLHPNTYVEPLTVENYGK